MSLVLFLLLQKLPGYRAGDLLAEDAELVDDWLTLMQCEAIVTERKLKSHG